MAGKGDTQRPKQISDAELEANWARIFDDGDRPDKARRKRCPDFSGWDGRGFGGPPD